MSLISQLHGGELGAWCADRLPGTRLLVDRVHSVARYARPIRPAGPVDAGHAAAVGGALSQRLAFVVQHAPPYAALLGAHSAGLAGWSAVQYAATAFLSHWGLRAEDRQRACQLRPTPTGWLDLDALGGPPARHPTEGSCEHTVLEFVARLAAYLAANAPAGDLAASRGGEAALARACWVLTGWEHTRPAPPPVARSVAELTAAAPHPVVDGLVALTAHLRTSGALHRLRALADNPPPGQPLGYARPVFVPHWASGDLLLGTGEATTLVDVTTATRLREPGRVDRWLFRLVTAAWLDVADRYRIRRVGIYLARHGLLLTWPLDELTATLLGKRDDGQAARREFLGLAAAAIAEEGAEPGWVVAPPRNLP